MFNRKNSPKNKFKPIGPVICCPLKAGTHVANCEENPDCENTTQCVVRKVKEEGNWIASGIEIISDYSISLRLKKLMDDFKALDKNKRKPNSDIAKREAFTTKLESLFDISDKNAEKTSFTFF